MYFVIQICIFLQSQNINKSTKFWQYGKHGNEKDSD